MTSTAEKARPTRLDAATLREWVESGRGPRILDVRTPAEFESLHIPGSYNVPLDTLREHREELRAQLDEPIALVCRSGMRAEQAEQALAETGMPNLHVLDGGIDSWERIDGPVKRGRARWDIDRQVRLIAGSLVTLGIVGSTAVPELKWLSGAVGAGLAGAALTNTCTMGMMLAKLPFNRGASCDVQQVIGQLIADRRS